MDNFSPRSLRIKIVIMEISMVFLLLVSVFLFWSGAELVGAILGVPAVFGGGMLAKTWFDIRGLSEEDHDDET